MTDDTKLLTKLRQQYIKVFRDNIPLEWIGKSTKEKIDIITECLKTKKPYKHNFPKGAIL